MENSFKPGSEQKLEQDQVRWAVGKISQAARIPEQQKAIEAIVGQLESLRKTQEEILPVIIDELELRGGLTLDDVAQANLKTGLEMFTKREMDAAMKKAA